MPLKTVRFERVDLSDFGFMGELYDCSIFGDQSGEYVLFKHFDDLAKERDVLKEKNAAISEQLAVAWEDIKLLLRLPL